MNNCTDVPWCHGVRCYSFERDSNKLISNSFYRQDGHERSLFGDFILLYVICVAFIKFQEKFKREFKSLLGFCIFCCKQNRSSYNNINKSQNDNSEMTSQRNSIKSNRSDSHFKLVSRKRTDASKGDNQNDYDCHNDTFTML
jgi:hypothetical protein